MNTEFQELRRLLGINSGERENIIQRMRENLIQRNSCNLLYVYEYTTQGTTVDLSTCGIEELLSVDGDMNPRGI